MLEDRDQLLRQLRQNLEDAQHRMEQKANKKRREVEFEVGEMALLRLQPYRQTSVARRVSHKLAKRYYGPFKITERIGKVAYRLELPQGSKIHPVFHVSLLKRYTGEGEIKNNELPKEFFHDHPISKPLAICATRQVLRHGKLEKQLLVQWNDSPLEDATWEKSEEIQRLYPNIHLEDKVTFEEGRSVTTVHENNPNACESHQESDVNTNKEKEVRRSTRIRKAPVWLKDYVH